MKALRYAVLLGTAFAITACASTPMGPTVRVLPPKKGKTFEQFQMDEYTCKQYANSQVSGQAERANQTAFLEGLGGTALGAGLGAAIGGGQGAAIGAASGAVAGTAVGAHTSSNDQKGIQVQYDNAYVSCMVSKGNKIDRPVMYAPPQGQTTVIYTQPPAPPPAYYGD